MGVSTTGAVVLVPFPFSDPSQTKVRPAVCLAGAGRGDWILCQITSNPNGDPNAIKLGGADFAQGSLNLTSYARPGKLFTASAGLILRSVGLLKPEILDQLRAAVVEILQSPAAPI